MSDMEKMVWVASFAAEFSRERAFLDSHGKSIDDVSGFSCAEVADVALDKYREAIRSESAEYLTPVQKGWCGDGK